MKLRKVALMQEFLLFFLSLAEYILGKRIVSSAALYHTLIKVEQFRYFPHSNR
jgi:hypothetical protein